MPKARVVLPIADAFLAIVVIVYLSLATKAKIGLIKISTLFLAILVIVYLLLAVKARIGLMKISTLF